MHSINDNTFFLFFFFFVFFETIDFNSTSLRAELSNKAVLHGVATYVERKIDESVYRRASGRRAGRVTG